MNQGKGPESQTEPGRRGFHQEEASRGEKQLPLTIRCVRKARPDIMQGQFREVGDNFLRRHPSCQVLQNVLDRDPQPTDTRFSTSLTRLHGDDFLIVHSPKVLELCHTSNSRRRIPQAAYFYSANAISCNRLNFCWLRFTRIGEEMKQIALPIRLRRRRLPSAQAEAVADASIVGGDFWMLIAFLETTEMSLGSSQLANASM